MKAKTKLDKKKVRQKAKAGSFNGLGHAGAAIRLVAKRSIRRSATPSAEGQPPHTRQGRLRNAIRYAVDQQRQSVVIGPDAAIAGTSGSAHEFGGVYRDEVYPRRPFMGPALQRVQERLPKLWAHSVKRGA